MRDVFKRQVLPVLNTVTDQRVVGVILDLDLRADDLWVERRAQVGSIDLREPKVRLERSIHRVYDLLLEQQPYTALLRTAYAYGQSMLYQGSMSAAVLISAGATFERELPAVRAMPSLAV